MCFDEMFWGLYRYLDFFAGWCGLMIKKIKKMSRHNKRELEVDEKNFGSFCMVLLKDLYLKNIF